MTSLGDILAVASPAERVVPLCVDGKLLAEHEELVAQLQRAHEDSSAGLDDTSVRDCAEKVQRVEAAMAAHTFTFRFRALAPKEWSDLLAEHPPRSGKNEAFNADTFPTAAVAACCVEPSGLDAAEDAAQLFERLPNAAQRAELFSAAFEVNAGTVDVPKSALASVVLRNSAPSSTSVSSEESLDPSS